METMKHAQVGLFVFTITASGSMLADCPDTMPSRLLQDCVVYESAGSGPSFPAGDYAHMNLYNDWLKEQLGSKDTQKGRLRDE